MNTRTIMVFLKTDGTVLEVFFEGDMTESEECVVGAVMDVEEPSVSHMSWEIKAIDRDLPYSMNEQEYIVHKLYLLPHAALGTAILH